MSKKRQAPKSLADLVRCVLDGDAPVTVHDLRAIARGEIDLAKLSPGQAEQLAIRLKQIADTANNRRWPLQSAAALVALNTIAPAKAREFLKPKTVSRSFIRKRV